MTNNLTTDLELTEIDRQMIDNYLMEKLKINIDDVKKLEENYLLS